MYKALVCCRAGMGTSMLLKIKADQIIKANDLPIETVHGNVDSLVSFNGDLVITMSDLYDELSNKVPYVVGIDSIIDKEEIERKLKEYVEWKKTH